MVSMMKKCVVLLGVALMTALSQGRDVQAQTLGINDGISWVDFHDSGWVNWVVPPEGYRIYKKLFSVKTPTMTSSTGLLSLPQGTPVFPATNRLVRTFSDPAGQFRITLDQSVNGGASTPLSGRSILKSTVNIENLTATPLKITIGEVSSYAIINYFDTDRDNVALIGNKVYFSNFTDIPLGSPAKGGMVTKAFTVDDAVKTPLAPTTYSFANCSNTPCTTSNTWPTPQNGKQQVDLKWDLNIPASASSAFTITDELLPGYPMTSTVSHSPSCSTVNGLDTYTINLDNYANLSSASNATALNAKVSTVLPQHVTFVSASNSGIYDAATRTVSWNVGSLAPQSGAQTLQVIVSNTSSKNVTLKAVSSSDNLYPTVVSDTSRSCVNAAPTFTTSMIPGRVIIGIPYSYQVKAVDPNDDVVRYSLNCGSAGCPAGLKIDAVTGVISWLVTDPTMIGRDKAFWIVATDERGLAQYQGASLGVRNTVPVFQAPYASSVYFGQSLAFQAKATDADGHSLTYSALGTVPSGMSVNAAGLVSWTPTLAQIGTAAVTIRVSDSWSTKDQAYSFSVLNPVSITSAPVTTAKTGVAYSYQVVATHALSKPLSYTLVSAPTGMTISAAGLVAWTPTTAQLGSFPVTVKVSDGTIEKTQVYSISVTAVVPPMVFASTPVTQAVVGQQYTYLVELANTADYTAGCSLYAYPAGMSGVQLGAYIKGITRVIWTPTIDQGGKSFPVTLVCYDTRGTVVQQNYSVTVNP